LSIYRSKSTRPAAQNDAAQFVERPVAHNANETQPTESPALGIEKFLTRREAEVARAVAAGLSNKQIARKASISEATVKIHLHNAYKKLGIANRSMLAVMVSSGARAWDQGQ
jgi:DNA-binding NarL/FixJ family response regulator